MARNRQRARDRKRKSRENGQHDDAEEVVGPSLSKGDDSIEPPDDDDDLEPDDELGDDEPIASQQLARGSRDAAVPVRRQKGNKVANFARACVAELKRVDWPDRRQVGQATAVVLGFVVIAGAFLGLADVAAQKLVDLIL